MWHLAPGRDSSEDSVRKTTGGSFVVYVILGFLRIFVTWRWTQKRNLQSLPGENRECLLGKSIKTHGFWGGGGAISRRWDLKIGICSWFICSRVAWLDSSQNLLRIFVFICPTQLFENSLNRIPMPLPIFASVFCFFHLRKRVSCWSICSTEVLPWRAFSIGGAEAKKNMG